MYGRRRLGGSAEDLFVSCSVLGAISCDEVAQLHINCHTRLRFVKDQN